MPADTHQSETMPAHLRLRGKAIVGAALLFAAAAVVIQNGFAQLTFFIVSGVLLSAAISLWIGLGDLQSLRVRHVRQAAKVLKTDPIAAFVTDANLRLLHQNPAAQDAFFNRSATSLSAILEDEVAGAGPLLLEMVSAASTQSVEKTIRTMHATLKVECAQLSNQLFFWRLVRASHDVGLHEAPIACVTADDRGNILSLNKAAQAIFDPETSKIQTVFPGFPIQSGEQNVVNLKTGQTNSLVVERIRGAGLRDVFLFPVALGADDIDDDWAYFEALPVPLLRLSVDGVLELSNKHARELLGVASGEGRRLSELIEGPGRQILDWLRDAADRRGTIQPEIVRVKRDDKEVFVQIALTPIQDIGKTVLIAVLHDATKLKSLEAQFVQSQKMQAIGQLAGGVAHDFNNLLTAITGHCDLLLLRHQSDDSDFSDLMQINQNANRAAALVSQLLAYSRKQTLRLEVMDLRDMLSELTHLLNRLVGERVTLTLHHGPELWAVRVDKRQLEQVLMNLVVNARDAMPDGGEIRLKTENIELKSSLQRDRAIVAPGKYVKIVVVDEGLGIQKDQIQKVFEPFFTTKKQGEGTGLGLSTAYGIVKQSGGFIFVDSVPNQGTEFTMFFPACEQPRSIVSSTKSPVSRSGPAKGVVLLVEDEAPVRAFASRALKMRGLSVVEAASGEEALSLLEEKDLHFDVFVTDVVMPGSDGPTWVRKALSNRPGTRVVFVSGYASDVFEDVETQIPNSTFLQKPFSLTELIATVQNQLPK